MNSENDSRLSDRLYKRYCDSGNGRTYQEGALGRLTLLTGALICIPIESLIIGIRRRSSRRRRNRNPQV